MRGGSGEGSWDGIGDCSRNSRSWLEHTRVGGEVVREIEGGGLYRLYI